MKMSNSLEDGEADANKNEVYSFFDPYYIICEGTQETEYLKNFRKVFDSLEKRRTLPKYETAVEVVAKQNGVQGFLDEVLGVRSPKTLKPEEEKLARDKLESNLKLYFEALENGTEAEQTKLFNLLRQELNTQYEAYSEKNGFTTREVAHNLRITDATGEEVDLVHREKRSVASFQKVTLIEDTNGFAPSPEAMNYLLTTKRANPNAEKQDITEEQVRSWAEAHGYRLVKQTIDNAQFVRKKATLIIDGTKIRIDGEKQREMLIAIFSAEGKTLSDKRLHLDEFFEEYENEDGALSYSEERAAFKKKCLATMRGLNQKIRKAGFLKDFIQTANDDFFINPDILPE